MNGNITWRCLSTSCKGKIKTHNNDIISQSEHNHAPNPESNAAYHVSSTMKVQAIVTNNTPRAIYQEVTSRIPLSVASHIPSFPSTQRRINCIRNNSKEPENTDIDTSVETSRGAPFLL